jgi:hypothetical protein
MFALPVWAAGAFAALLLVLCIFVFNRAARDGLIGVLARVGLLAIGAAVAWMWFDGAIQRDLAIERRALDVRATELMARTITPGSALACLNAAAGDAVEGACEKALFATPEATAAAVAYVSAQLALLANAGNYARHAGNYEPSLAQLRHAVETDRFGIVAHVLAAREGCTADRCAAFALFQDTGRISANLAERAYDSVVVRYAAAWPVPGAAPVASVAPPTSSFAAIPGTTTGLPVKPPGPNVFFPSAASIPPVNIMNAEPAATPQETTGSGAAPDKPAARPPTPPRRPAQATPQARRPVDLNAEAARAAPPAAATVQ